jgi:hypothetical protein
MNHRLRFATFTMVAVLALMGTERGAAQNTPAPRADPKACSDEQRMRLPNGSAAPSTGSSNQTLSEKLERSEGVVCPPAGVDPEIAVPPTGGGITPVIPPPGAPGGDPTVRPK